MLNHQTIDLLNSLKLSGMANALEAQLNNAEIQSLSFEERLALLVESEQNERLNRRQRRLIRDAKLKISSACLENISYSSNRRLDRSQINELANCNWIERAQHLLITGYTGVGKTWLSCAFGMAAIRHSLPVVYYRVRRLLEESEIARADGSLPKLRTRIAKCKLLIMDDWGMSPLTDIGRQDLLEFVDDRAGTGSIIIASQLPVKSWYEYINQPTFADAILDRIVHRAHKIDLHGPSMRKKLGMDEEAA